MKKSFKKSLLIILILCFKGMSSFAGNGDSIFHMNYIHSLYITFPYSTFYDSLINTNTTGLYLKVDIQFNNETIHEVGIRVKGNSSFNNPSQKKSFKLDFNEFVNGQDLHGLKKLNFNNSFKDPSFMREKLANDFLIDHNLAAPRTTYCNVYMNGQLWGLYTIVEAIDDEFCDHWFGSNDGNLFQGDPHGDLRWKGASTQSLYQGDYELQNNSTANNWTDLISFIDVLNNTAVNNLYPLLDTKINTASFVKHWAVQNIFSSLDAYIGSGHNYYIYHDTITDKFQWIAWDNNEAFGSFKNNLTTAQLKNLDMYYLSQPTNRPLCNQMLKNATYKEMYNQAYCEMNYEFTHAYFDQKIDSLKNVIQASVYNDPKKFYTNALFDSSFNYDVTLPGPMPMTVFGLKNFITERAAAVNQNIGTNQVTCWPMETTSLAAEPFMLYPQPSEGVIVFSKSYSAPYLIIHDMSGRKWEIKMNDPYRLDLSFLPSGLYFLRDEEGGIHRFEMIKP